MAGRIRDFDDDFASPADYGDGFRESDAVRGERALRRQRPFERMQQMLGEMDRNGAGDGPDRQLGE